MKIYFKFLKNLQEFRKNVQISEGLDKFIPKIWSILQEFQKLLQLLRIFQDLLNFQDWVFPDESIHMLDISREWQKFWRSTVSLMWRIWRLSVGRLDVLTAAVTENSSTNQILSMWDHFLKATQRKMGLKSYSCLNSTVSWILLSNAGDGEKCDMVFGWNSVDHHVPVSDVWSYHDQCLMFWSALQLKLSVLWMHTAKDSMEIKLHGPARSTEDTE